MIGWRLIGRQSPSWNCNKIRVIRESAADHIKNLAKILCTISARTLSENFRYCISDFKHQNMKHLFSSIALLALALTNTASAQDVTMGKQKWNSKNLNVTTFRNGSVIPQVQDGEDWLVMGLFREPAWCYYQTPNGIDSSCGKLYNWYAVNDARGLAPQGWHIATQEDWENMSKSQKGKKVRLRRSHPVRRLFQTDGALSS